ncbi:hypothetical protein XAP412_960091 [Xanthomonas phaseoli pv. phaseoli]|uniref:Uncharacterized protein n=1 Tax=Xanthomonas campestris pv. phaseoli TaxID=317013 RepID=A0AB38E7T9_XANCH|nr:hypothetical protein XAP6984_990094 [Xanthomonas phaseoli pv. phaseoli]SON91862.1 hypothetical protein XAP412_960091 [Xanthomonas phaseoli pv. phaseoli]SON93192.1 hypothetical protein XAP7430_980091 [Xanthomonas phaseoli pv. phaseoli]SOO30224.1 hypothetical protein XAP6164_4180003 [Xanthomonas phaseoli pv. phaseoli]
MHYPHNTVVGWIARDGESARLAHDPHDPWEPPMPRRDSIDIARRGRGRSYGISQAMDTKKERGFRALFHCHPLGISARS